MQKILVIGSGAREDALAWKFAQSKRTRVFCAPGNPGVSAHGTRVPIDPMDFAGLLNFARTEGIDFTVVGPEGPLVGGIVDHFRNAGQAICGPSKRAAWITEGSKIEFKRFLARHHFPTAPFRVFVNYSKAVKYVRERGAKNIVIKADGLMGGKGVFLPNSLEEANNALIKLLRQGNPKDGVLIEDRIYGTERSVMAITDGIHLHMLPFTQDYKRVGEGDTGENTGGMGAHTLSLPFDEATELEDFVRRVTSSLRNEGIYYTGFIYLGIMVTENGPMVLECNCRLGDPETQVILPSLDGDFAKLCLASTKIDGLGRIRTNLPTQVRQALCVVLTSGEYPEPSSNSDPITGITEAEQAGALVFQAGTELENGVLTTNKAGRVMSVVGIGPTLHDARTVAYDGVEEVHFRDMKYRSDIGRMAA
jgi:phosphoribosylamine--glycine ligase